MTQASTFLKKNLSLLKWTPSRDALLRKYAKGDCIRDLLFTMPSAFIDRSNITTIKDTSAKDTSIKERQASTIVVEVLSHHKGFGRRPYRIFCQEKNQEHTITLLFFRAHLSYLEERFPYKQSIIISGQIEKRENSYQMVHPERIWHAHEWEDTTTRYETVYRTPRGLSSREVESTVRKLLTQLPSSTNEWLPEALLKKKHWPSWQSAICGIHAPFMVSHSPQSCLERLVFDDFLSYHIQLTQERKKKQTGGKITYHNKSDLYINVSRDSLPFSLTQSQESALADIVQDMKKPTQMRRLLHGDVGTGKTAIALLAIHAAVGAGGQAALVVPLELLARQHYKTFTETPCEGVFLDILTGQEKASHAKRCINELALGEINVIIGTHAVLSPRVHFKNLTLVVIDEQHRFGVKQRASLLNKGDKPDMLVMSATPIPRTMQLLAYGDLDNTTIAEKPPGRGDLETYLSSMNRLEECENKVIAMAKKGYRIYWVCPFIEAQGSDDNAAIKKRWKSLETKSHLSTMAHGRMKAPHLAEAIADFRAKHKPILVATSVIEVGIDVPEADIIVIEEAQRFGIAQLHQLRGRVGRGKKKGICILLYHEEKLNPVALERLKTIKEKQDGFAIAQQDLSLRNPGDLLGTRQSGMPQFWFGHPQKHKALLLESAQWMQKVLNSKELLTLYGKEEMEEKTAQTKISQKPSPPKLTAS